MKWSKTIYEVEGIDGYRIQLRSKNNHVLYKSPNDLKVVKGNVSDAELDNNQIWQVETILKHKKMKSGNKYLVKWKNYDEPTWEPQKNLRLINKNKMSQLEIDYFAKK